VFLLGGSWSGGVGGENGIAPKDAEVLSPETGRWKKLPGVKATSILTKDPEGTYRADNHGWFFAWSNAEGVGAATCLPLSIAWSQVDKCVCMLGARFGDNIWTSCPTQIEYCTCLLPGAMDKHGSTVCTQMPCLWSFHTRVATRATSRTRAAANDTITCSCHSRVASPVSFDSQQTFKRYIKVQKPEFVRLRTAHACLWPVLCFRG
jgi:hypothetical protein